MKIQQIKEDSITTKGLYFARKKPICNQYFHHVNISEQKFSKEGAKYIEDTNISHNLRESISEIPFVKEMAEKFDTFIVYTEDKFKKAFSLTEEEEFQSTVEMYIVDGHLKRPKEFFFLGNDDMSIQEAQKKCIDKIRKKL